MESTYFVVTFLVLVFGVASFLKDRANSRLAGDVLYEGKKVSNAVIIIKRLLVVLAIIYILYEVYNAIKGGNILLGMDMGVFVALYYIVFANYYINPVILAEEGVIKYNNFIRWKHIKEYNFKDINGEKYKLILRYKRPSEMKTRKLVINIYNRDEIQNILKENVIRTNT